MSSSVQNLESSRAEALQGLLSSLGYTSGGLSPSDAKLSQDQWHKLSEKVDEMLGNGGDHGGLEPDQLLNEEGLPIVDISEPVSQNSQKGDVPTSASESDLVPLSLLLPDERERRRRERDSILDLLEEEERLQQLQEERDMEEERKEAIRKRKESAKAELEQLKAAKEFHKRMGKALVGNSQGGRRGNGNSGEEMVPAKTHPPSQAVRKTVSFADALEIDEEEKQDSKRHVDWGDVAAGRLRASSRIPLVSTAETENYPMKIHVVERFPTAAPTSITSSGADSDDESASSAGRRSPDGTSEEEVRSLSTDAGSSDQEPMEEEFDYDSAQHHREIALEYHEKRRAIGAEAAKAMAGHALNDYELDEIVQSSGKLPLSRFRADRMAAAYDRSHDPASISIGPSIIPASRQKSLRNSVRLGKLENGQLVGGESGESGSEDETVREVLQMLRTGSIQNAGPDFDPSSLTRVNPPSTGVVESPSIQSSTPTQAQESKPSRFKLSRGGGTAEMISTQDYQTEGDERQSKPAVAGVIERKAPRPSPSQHFPINPAARRSPGKAPEPAFSMVIDSPSFPMPTAGTPASTMATSTSFPTFSNIVESPSFPRKQPGAVESGGRLQRPPSVTSSMENVSHASSQGPPSVAKSGRSMSRFMKERQ